MNCGKKVLSLLLMLSLCLSLLCVPAMAAGTTVTTATDLQTALNNGGNVILGSDIGVTTTLTVKSTSNLDLNGHKLSVITTKYQGIVISVGQTLTISDSKYSDSASNSGQLYVNGYNVGIQTSGATLIINSGVVEAKNQHFGAGIGGTNTSGYRDGGTVVINGGTVTATGSSGGAGIGGSDSGGSGGVVTINGGTVIATGSTGGATGGAGIGGGEGGNGGIVTINGGTVTAIGVTFGAGIGGGGDGSGGTVRISGGYVKVSSSSSVYAIGSGYRGADGGSLEVTGGILEFASSNTNVTAPIFKDCIITGASAGGYKGGYDSVGNRIVVEGASAWATENIVNAVVYKLVPNDLQTNYTMPITRAEFCALGVALYEVATGKEITERKVFSDTSDINVQKMGALGVVGGVGDDRFDPNGTLTREAAATILARLASVVGTPLPEQSTTFADKGKISSWAIAEVGQVQAAGIMNGMGENQFDPFGQYTREQSIITILRLFNAVKQ